MNNAPIGIFDSGLGGTTLWRVVRRLLPEESLIYLGDGVNCPYGERPCEDVRRLSEQAIVRLMEAGCKMIVVACNTATAAAIEYLRDKYRDMIFVGMEPAIKPACLNTRSRVVGVLATKRSLDGDLFHRTAARYGHDIEIVAHAGDGFVELVEGDKEGTAEAEMVVRRVVEPMVRAGVDQIVLGCSHYPYLMPVLERVAPGVTFLDPSDAVARRVVQLLESHDIVAERGHVPSYEFLTYGDQLYRSRLRDKAFGL